MKKHLALVFGACVVACGGATIEPIPDGGPDASPIQDAGSPYCPSSAPSSGSSCNGEGLYCEYGSDPSLSCNTVARCMGGHWNVQGPYGQCPTPANPSACPATFASVPVGEHCGDLVGTTCSYPQGFCGCSVGSGGPYPEDASAVATWICDAPAQGCPMPRPKLGTACAQENLECDYSPCSLPSGASIICQQGAWQDLPYGCAL